ncbi:hypothetical protein V7S43_016665 [Phytophthora oleae]|uniref:Uncharacterized protein n=1 Tax=Phytophthora oleae TaxID=2107226 RepID=A0ABD3EVQ2_9STRA
MKADRDPDRNGSPIFRTNVQTQQAEVQQTKKTGKGVKKVATVQHVTKKQRTARKPLTNVEMDGEFAENGLGGDDGGWLLSLGIVDASWIRNNP